MAKHGKQCKCIEKLGENCKNTGHEYQGIYEGRHLNRFHCRSLQLGCSLATSFTDPDYHSSWTVLILVRNARQELIKVCETRSKTAGAIPYLNQHCILLKNHYKPHKLIHFNGDFKCGGEFSQKKRELKVLNILYNTCLSTQLIHVKKPK